MITPLRHIVLLFTLLLIVLSEGRAFGIERVAKKNGVFEAADNATRLRYSKAWNHLDLAESSSKLDPTVLTKLGDDLLDSDFATFLEGGVGRVKAWEVLKNTPHRIKIGSLEFFSDPSVLVSRQNILNSNIPGQFPNIPLEELIAIQHYTTNAYTSLNAALRSGSPSDYFKAFEELVNDGLSKLPDFNGSVVYRGVSGGEATLAKTWNVGDKPLFKDFKSSSTSTNVAGDFTGDVFFEITNPKGK